MTIIHSFVRRLPDFNLVPPLPLPAELILIVLMLLPAGLTGRWRGCHMPPQLLAGFGLRGERHLLVPHGFGVLPGAESLLPQLTRFTFAKGRLDHSCCRLRPNDRSSHPLLPHFVTFHRLLKSHTYDKILAICGNSYFARTVQSLCPLPLHAYAKQGQKRRPPPYSCLSTKANSSNLYERQQPLPQAPEMVQLLQSAFVLYRKYPGMGD